MDETRHRNGPLDAKVWRNHTPQDPALKPPLNIKGVSCLFLAMIPINGSQSECVNITHEFNWCFHGGGGVNINGSYEKNNLPHYYPFSFLN